MTLDRQLFGRKTSESVQLDATDFHILRLLVHDGRASFAALGEAVGLSARGAADRVRRLERDGVITSFTALVDLGQVGRALEAYIDVRLLSSVDPDEFEKLVRDLPAIRELAFVTGRFDYQVRVACSDAEELDLTVRSLRQSGAGQTETRIVMRSAALAGSASWLLEVS